MSLWTTSTSSLETALAAAIGSTLQQHTITNNLKGGQTHILQFGNGNLPTNHHNNNNSSQTNANHISNNGHSTNTPHQYSNSSSSHSNHQQHPTTHHHGSTSSFFGNSNPNLAHISSHNNLHSSNWARNNICSNHKVNLNYYFGFFIKFILSFDCCR